MMVRPDWRPRPSQLDTSTAAATSSMTVSAETLVSHLEILRSERVGELTPEQVRFVETAERQGLRLLRLIQDLRTVALVETGALELDWGTCELGEITQRAADRIASVALARRKPIEPSLGGPSRVWADGPRLERALLGVLEHAVEEAQATTPIALSVEGSEIEVRYLADGSDPDSLGLALANAVTMLHGGAVSRREDDGEVSLVLSLGGELAAEAPERPAAAAA
jgi:hypothetical protein